MPAISRLVRIIAAHHAQIAMAIHLHPAVDHQAAVREPDRDLPRANPIPGRMEVGDQEVAAALLWVEVVGVVAA
jgi:hypothetical protein